MNTKLKKLRDRLDKKIRNVMKIEQSEYKQKCLQLLRESVLRIELDFDDIGAMLDKKTQKVNKIGIGLWQQKECFRKNRNFFAELYYLISMLNKISYLYRENTGWDLDHKSNEKFLERLYGFLGKSEEVDILQNAREYRSKPFTHPNNTSLVDWTTVSDFVAFHKHGQCIDDLFCKGLEKCLFPDSVMNAVYVVLYEFIDRLQEHIVGLE